MKLTLFDKRHEADDAFSFFFRSEEPFYWKAGQYLYYTLPHLPQDARKNERWFTIASAPHEGHVMLTTRISEEQGSSFKKALASLPMGSVIEAKGPKGNFVIDDPEQHYVLIAGGIGITPYRSILLDLDHRRLPINIQLLYTNRTPDFIFKKELEALDVKYHSFHVRYFVDHDRMDEGILRKTISNPGQSIIYLSGPKPMAEAFETTLLEMEIPESRLKRDYFPGYSWP